MKLKFKKIHSKLRSLWMYVLLDILQVMCKHACRYWTKQLNKSEKMNDLVASVYELIEEIYQDP